MNLNCSFFLLVHQLLLLLFLSYANSQCVLTRDCKTAQDYIKFRNYNSTIKSLLRNAICGFDNYQNPKIQCDVLPPFSDCIPINECPYARRTVNTTQNFISSLCGTRSDFINCIDYSKKMLEPQLTNTCGIVNNPIGYRISNGEPANSKEFPWLVLFEYNNTLLTCAGVLIHKRYIVTAGHCINGYEHNIMAVRLGVYNKTNHNDGIKYSIKKLHIHPQYNNSTSKGDIALVRLGKKNEINQSVTNKT